jgi:hypothetical protein
MTGPFSSRRTKRSAIVASMALAGGALAGVSAVPAAGTLSGPGVRPGSNITVFHNIDFVAVFGYGPVGSRVTVRVIRRGVVIGSATGPAIDAEGLPGLEVNHGPEGPARPGDCWDGHTPDIKPGDVIRVTDSRRTDQVTVDNIAFTDGPSELTPGGDIVVPFVAQRANGAAIPVNFIDSAEFRAGSDVRFEGPDIIVEADGSGTPGAYRMRYEAPFTPSRNRELLNQDQLRAQLMDPAGAHATGFGHVDPLPRESMLYDGLEDTPGPAPGCEFAPTASAGVTSVSPGVINRRTPANRALTVSGMSANASEVQVRLTAGARRVTEPAVLRGPEPQQTWSATFPGDRLSRLRGTIRATAIIDGVASRVTKTVLKDTVAPDRPSASLRSGTYRGTQRITLNAGARGEQIRYTLRNRRAPRPTANRGQVYRGGQIRIVRSKTLKMVAIDRAGNVSPVTRERYRIRRR